MADFSRMWTPPQVARRLAIKAERVRAMIRSGELRAVDLASHGCRRPRFRVAEADLQLFLEKRAVKPPSPRPKRRRRDRDDTIQYF